MDIFQFSGITRYLQPFSERGKNVNVEMMLSACYEQKVMNEGSRNELSLKIQNGNDPFSPGNARIVCRKYLPNS